MKKYVVLGVNENPKYLYYIPLVMWAWKKLGWDFVLFHTIEASKFKMYDRTLIKHLKAIYPESFFYRLIDYQEIKSETIAQVSRLYGFLLGNGYFMTSDVDMLPLSDYWQYNENEVTTWGRDLTDYHYPICYVGMSEYQWRLVMKPFAGVSDVMRRDLVKQPNMWTLDQDIITKRLINYGTSKITHINRGTDPRTGYPIGRVDRSNWRLDHKVLIDAHLPHDVLTNEDSFRKVMELLHHVWPKEDFKWFLEFHKEFKKLL